MFLCRTSVPKILQARATGGQQKPLLHSAGLHCWQVTAATGTPGQRLQAARCCTAAWRHTAAQLPDMISGEGNVLLCGPALSADAELLMLPCADRREHFELGDIDETLCAHLLRNLCTDQRHVYGAVQHCQHLVPLTVDEGNLQMEEAMRHRCACVGLLLPQASSSMRRHSSWHEGLILVTQPTFPARVTGAQSALVGCQVVLSGRVQSST